MFLLRLFGSPVLEGEDGQPLGGRAAQRRRLALLGAIALARGGITRDKLLALFWPETPLERARDSLNEAIHVLRKGLGEDALVSVGEELRWNPGALRVDVAEFEENVKRDDLLAAVSCYRAPLLDGFFVDRAPEFERWADEERKRLAGLYRSALDQLATRAAARGDRADAVEWSRKLVMVDPYDAHGAMRLMEALAAAGNRAAALEHAQLHARLLASEFGIEPDAEVEALAERIRARTERVELKSVAPAPSTTTPAAPPPSPAPPHGAPHWALVSGALAVLALGAAAYLTWGRTRDGPAAPISLAVLPFTVLSSPDSVAFLGVGVADALITRFALMPGLIVRPTRAVVPYERGGPDVRGAGTALAVRYVLVGTIQPQEATVAVNARLVDVRNGSAVWSRDYRLAGSDLLSLPDSVAEHVAAVLPVAPPAVGTRAGTGGAAPSNAVAYPFYLQGRARLARHREPDIRAAIEAFEAALARDSTFALAHAGLAVASAEMHLRFATADDAPSWGERAVRSARRALELDSTLAEVHEALAAVHRKTEFDWPRTIAESRTALALNPGAAQPYFYMAGAYYHLGLLEEAERAVRTGLDVQPVGDRAEALRTLGTVALASGRYAEAVTLLQDVQRLSDRPVSDPHLATAYFYAGDVARAERLLDELVRARSASAASRARATLASIMANRGEAARAAALLREAERGVVDHHVAYSVGVAYAQLGRTADAVRWLRTAMDTGFRCYPWYARDPLLAPVRSEPGFEALLAELRRSWEADRARYGRASLPS